MFRLPLSLIVTSIVSLVLSGCLNHTEHVFTPMQGETLEPDVDLQSFYTQQVKTYRERVDVDMVEEYCHSLPHQTYEQTLSFPDPGETCAWSQNGNGGRENGTIRARRRQEHVYNVPERAVLCNVEFSSEEQNMRFDDEILLLVNERVLLSSVDYSDLFPVDEGFSVWDWASIYNTDYGWTYGDGYCLGRDDGLSTCEIPHTEQWGHISISFASALMYELSSSLSVHDQLVFSFVTTGDNDESDCRHEDYSFSVGIEYVVPEN